MCLEAVSAPDAWLTEDALAATASLPGLIAGARGPDGHLDVGGGLYDRVPVQACRNTVRGLSQALWRMRGEGASVGDGRGRGCGQ